MSKQSNNLVNIGLLILFLFFFIKYFNYSKSTVDAFDNLDGTFVNWSLLSNTYIEYFNPTFVIKQIGEGIMIGNIFPSISIGELSFKILHPYKAYILNEIFARVIAFIGFFLLINNHFKFKNYNLYISFSVSIAFSLLPFNPSPFLTVAGQPLLLYSILNFYKQKQNKFDWIICLIFPFYSSLVLGGFAILSAIFFILIFQIYKNKFLNSNLLSLLILMSVLYLLSIYKGLYLVFFEPDFQSIRSEFIYNDYNLYNNILSSLNNSLGIFLFGHEHAPSMHTYIILSSLIFSIFLIKKKKNIEDKIFYNLILLNFIISILYGILAYSGITSIVFKNFGFLKMIKFQRIHWLQPIIWYLLFYLSLTKINTIKNLNNKKIVFNKFIYFVIFIFIVILFLKLFYLPIIEKNYILSYPFIITKIENLANITLCFLSFFILIGFIYRKNQFFLKTIKYNHAIVFFLIFFQSLYNLNFFKMNKILTFDYRYSWHHNGIDTTTFDQYFNMDLFKEIKEYINKDQSEYKVGSVGISPSIPLFNGFNVVDFYLSSYDIKYKKKFRKVIEKELEKNSIIRHYYDNTGKRNYIYSSELGKNFIHFKKSVPKKINLDLNYTALKNLGCKYIFSITIIKNQNDKIKLLKRFNNIKYPHLNDIYLYKLI